jgi:hypothetical protein
MVPELEFKVGEHDYRATRMNAFDQFAVARPLRNVLASLAMIEEEVRKSKPKDPPTPHTFVQLMCTMAGGLTKEESDSSVSLCLSKVVRKSGAGWAATATPDGVLMFDDIGMSEMLEIVWHVLKYNGLIDFFAVSPSTSVTTEPTPMKDGHGSQTDLIGSSAQHLKKSATTNR